MSFACRRFRAAFSPGDPGAGAGHRQRCSRCDAYAEALERAAAARLPMPEGLRARLLALPAQPGAAPPGLAPVPQLPLPDGLRARLLALPAAAGRPRPPRWVLSPRYAIAASYLAAVLVGAALGDPGELGRRLARGIEQVMDRAETMGESLDRSLARLDGGRPRPGLSPEGKDQPRDDAPGAAPGGARRPR